MIFIPPTNKDQNKIDIKNVCVSSCVYMYNVMRLVPTKNVENNAVNLMFGVYEKLSKMSISSSNVESNVPIKAKFP